MKGQYLTIEYVIFFAIGISLIMGVYYTFGNVNVTLKDVAVQGQIDRVGENIRSSVVEVYISAKNTDSVINYDIEIPPKLSGSIYSIRMWGNELNVNSTDDYSIGKVLKLYNIPTSMEVENPIIYSTKGKITISANKDGVVLK